MFAISPAIITAVFAILIIPITLVSTYLYFLRLKRKFDPSNKPTVWTYINELGGYVLLGLIIVISVFWAMLSAWTKGSQPNISPARPPAPTSAVPANHKLGMPGAGDAEAYNNRGKAYAAKGEYDLAIAEYSKALQLKPNLVDAIYYRGLAYADKGDNDKAIADYSEAIRLAPDYELAYLFRGLACADKGDNDKAIADYSEAIRLAPDYALAYFFRGRAYANKGENDKAIADYSEAIRLKPEKSAYYAELYCRRGCAYSDKADYNQAIDDFSEAIRLKPDYALAYYIRGLAFMKKGEKSKADKDIAKAKQLDKNLP